MRVFVVGASGAIGSRLVPQLIHRGHKVIGTSRPPGNAGRLRASQKSAPGHGSAAGSVPVRGSRSWT
jgi:uncharacterized protein YbjT (DUF2867 family)